MALGGLWSKLTGGIFGFAIGAASADAIAPVLEPVRQTAWANRAYRVLDPNVAAELAAEQAPTPVDLPDDARRNGIGPARFDALVELAYRAPGVAQALELWRRGEIGESEVDHALRKARLPAEWHQPIKALRLVRLSPADVANAVQQGFVPGDGLLPGTVEGALPLSIPVEQVAIDPTGEAAASGVDADRLRVLAELSGNPPGPIELLDMWNRGIIDEASVERGIREGRTKTKWAAAIKQLRHFLLSPAEAAGLRLRGHITAAESYQLGALHGASRETMDQLWLNRGRPATTHQVHLGYVRGGRNAATGNDERATFERAIRESDIRDEWIDILWAQRYTYPSAFVLRALAQDGTFPQPTTERILLEMGWVPEYARLAAAKWAQGTGGTTREQTRSELADEYVTGFISETEYREALAQLGYVGHEQDLEVAHSSAVAVKTERARVVTALHKLFVSRAIDAVQARNDLDSVGMRADAIDRILPLWTLERDATRRQLTAAEIRREYRDGILTIDQAVAQLVERGYTAADASNYLAAGTAQ